MAPKPMDILLMALPHVVFLVLGVWFARRWVVWPPESVEKFPYRLRVGALILAGWLGTFAACSFTRHIGDRLNDGIAYDEGAEVDYLVMHDGVGDNVWCVLFGWSAGLVFLWIARLLAGGRVDFSEEVDE